MMEMDISEHRRLQDGRATIMVRGLPVDIRAASLPVDRWRGIGSSTASVKTTAFSTSIHSDFLPEVPARYPGLVSQGLGVWSLSRDPPVPERRRPFTARSTIERADTQYHHRRDRSNTAVAGIQTDAGEQEDRVYVCIGLRAALRSDPTSSSSVRSGSKTARIAAEAALTGHLVMSTLHANGRRIQHDSSDRHGPRAHILSTSALECIVAQRLLRRPLSPGEQKPLQAGRSSSSSRDVAHRDGTLSEVSLYRAEGLAHCGQSGLWRTTCGPGGVGG